MGEGGGVRKANAMCASRNDFPKTEDVARPWRDVFAPGRFILCDASASMMSFGQHVGVVACLRAETVCPSGLRGWTQVPLVKTAWVQIPQLSFISRRHARGAGGYENCVFPIRHSCPAPTLWYIFKRATCCPKTHAPTEPHNPMRDDCVRQCII